MKFQSLCVVVLAQLLAVTAQSFDKADKDVYVLIYETEMLTSKGDSPALTLLDQLSRIVGVTGMLIGQGTMFNGFGGKFASAKPILQKMAPDTLVVLSDSRDVLMNNPTKTNQLSISSSDMVQDFVESYKSITKTSPGAVVVSAEAQCCVSALTHVAPGGYFRSDGSRNQRACLSGMNGCLWKGDEAAFAWESFMTDLAIVRDSHHFDDIYLNAGLMTGTAKDLLALISAVDIKEDEDDQAVLTDYMFRYPEKIVLDYGQTLFGNNRAKNSASKETCVFELAEDGSGRLSHTITHTTPLFVHSPGGNFKCHDKQTDLLGVAASQKLREIRQSRQLDEVAQYRKGGDGVSDGASTLFDRLSDRISSRDSLSDKVDAFKLKREEKKEEREEQFSSFQSRFGGRL